MLLYLFVLLCTWLACSVVGFALLKCYNFLFQEKNTSPPVDYVFFAGFVFTAGISNWISIILSINHLTSIFYVLLVIILFSVLFKHIKLYLRDIFRSYHFDDYKRIILTVLIIALICTGFAASTEILVYDTGLYHTQSIKWIQEYPVVPGLGNLHGRFAFNSMFFPVSALFGMNIGGFLIYPVNLLIFLTVIGRLIFNIHFAVTQSRIAEVVFAGLAASALVWFHFHHLNSATVDVLCTSVFIYIVAILLRTKQFPAFPAFASCVLAGLIIFCIASKLSAALLVLFLVPGIISDFRKSWKPLLVTGLFLLIPFIIRNYYISGYLVYPFPNIDLFNPDWKIPIATVMEMKEIISSWAKIPYADPEIVALQSMAEWSNVWWNNLTLLIKVLLAFGILTPLFILWSILRKETFHAIIATILFLNIVFWFFNAPDPRFAYGFILTNVALILSAGIPWQKLIPQKGIPILAVLASVGLVLLLSGVVYLKRDHLNLSFSRILLPVKNSIVPELSTFRTNFSLFVPVNDDRCFNAPLPCTTQPKPEVILRNNDLGSGFKIQGS